MQEIDEAIDIATAHFSRCSNFPKSGKGMTQLAQSLQRVSAITGVSMDRIADWIARGDQYCPTDARLQSAAEHIAYCDQLARGVVEKKVSLQPKCEKCHDTGWYRFQKMVYPPRVEPYIADFCKPCNCGVRATNQYQQTPHPNAPDCELCGDWGHHDDPVTKLRVWCQCEMGKWQESQHPGLVEALNGNKARLRAFSAPITRKEIKSTPEWLKELEGKYDAG